MVPSLLKTKQRCNPPTPKASAWQALTCLAVAPLIGAKEERPTSNEEDILLLPMLTRGRQTSENRGQRSSAFAPLSGATARQGSQSTDIRCQRIGHSSGSLGVSSVRIFHV